MEVNPHDRAMTGRELEVAIQGVDGFLCLLTDTIDSKLLDLNPELKVLANYAVGYDNIDVKACTEKGIPVSNTPGVLTDTTADLAFTLIMSIARRVVEADKFTRMGKYEGWGPMLLLGNDIYQKKIGIIGMGRIGQAVARRAVGGFDMDVMYYDINRNKEVEEELGLKYKSFEELLAKSDFISIHVPLNQYTEKLIGEDEFEMMKDSAYIINTSRGAIIDETALLQALRENKIAGAGLDVYEDEPKLTPGLANINNLVLLPHLGSATVETRTKMAVMAAKNLLAGLKGDRMPNIVNPEVFYR